MRVAVFKKPIIAWMVRADPLGDIHLIPLVVGETANLREGERIVRIIPAQTGSFEVTQQLSNSSGETTERRLGYEIPGGGMIAGASHWIARARSISDGERGVDSDYIVKADLKD